MAFGVTSGHSTQHASGTHGGQGQAQGIAAILAALKQHSHGQHGNSGTPTNTGLGSDHITKT